MTAYSDPWDVTTPAGADERRFGDDRIREMKRAIEQRMETFVNWIASLDDTTSPLRPKPDTIPPGALQALSVVQTNLAVALKAVLRTTLVATYVPTTTSSFAAGTTQTETVSVPTALPGDAVIVVQAASDADMRRLIVRGIVTALNTVTMYYTNPSTATLVVSTAGDPWKVYVIKALT